MNTAAITGTGPATTTTAEERKSYLDLIQDHPWQTHLPPSPEGRLLAQVDYCEESGDIAHFILDPQSREIIAACIIQPLETPRYFLKQENGLMAPVTKAESRKALDRLNAKARIEWSYPPDARGKPRPERYRPMGPDLTPTFANMLDAHEWKNWYHHTINGHVESRYVCGICLAQMHTISRRNGALTHAKVRLPGLRECHYLRTENAIRPVSDTDFYGVEPLRIGQAPSAGRSRTKTSQS